MYNTIEESLNKIEEGLMQDQKRGGRGNDVEHFNKELKKVKKYPIPHSAPSPTTRITSPTSRSRT